MEKENDAETLKRKHEVEDDDFDAPKVRNFFFFSTYQKKLYSVDLRFLTRVYNDYVTYTVTFSALWSVYIFRNI